MVSSETEAGKQWILSKFIEIAQELGITAPNLEWGESVGDFDHLQMSLAYDISGTRHVEKFHRTDVDHCLGDPAVQARLADQIRKRLESLLPRPKRIGF